MVRLFSYLLDFGKPLFRKCIVSINQLRCGTHLTGRVTNITTFGAFIDVGIGRDALLHRSKLPQGNNLGAGDIVDVVCLNVDQKNNRIELRLR